MRFTFLSLLLALHFTLQPAMAASKVDPALVPFARGQAMRATTVIGILNTAKSVTESTERPSKYDSRAVVRFLKNRASASWKELESNLTRNGSLNHSIKLIEVLWINNSFIAVVTPTGLKALAESDAVKKIYSNRKLQFEHPRREGRGPHSEADDAANLPYDFAETNLTKLMTEAPQITGKGVLLGSVDTGVDGVHPALSGKIAVFYDGTTKKTGEPKDYDSHGTHTAGTMVGGNRKDILIGMAPDAKLIAAGPLADYDVMIKDMQFLLEPKGKDTTPADLPRAVNNSWHCGGAPDIELFYSAISAWEAAGILPVFSAGNAGPGTGTITPCHEHPSVIAIGATGRDGKLTNFSSRGPGKYKGQDVQKPDITAPGDKINSSLPNGKYGEYSGTSMAAPHVTGAAALLYQIEPKLTPAQVRAIFVKTAVPTSEDGSKGAGGVWNKMYGFGKLDIYAAAKAALSIHKERNSIDNGPMDLLGNLLKTPSQIDVLPLMGDPGNIADSDFEIPAAYEGDDQDWAEPSAIWK